MSFERESLPVYGNAARSSGECDHRPRFRPITRRNVDALPQWHTLSADLREAVEVVSLVLPFRTNEYIVDELIDWDRVPDDPIFQLTFPQRGMLSDEHYATVRSLHRAGADPERMREVVHRIRYQLNPQPDGQKTHNIPVFEGEPFTGLQHKYRETVLFFPRQGQTCHAYCTYCFRWAQFVGMDELRFAEPGSDRLVRYLRAHPEVTDVIVTGGDPLIMKTAVLERLIEPLLAVDSLTTIRIGTKMPGYWPHRAVTDADADDLLRLFERVVRTGKHLAIMVHYSHPAELSTTVVRRAVRRLRATGAVVRIQAPLIRHVNDDPRAWVELWRTGVRLGAVPYYMFVERDTGGRRYFEIPLVRCWEIFQRAYTQVSGLARTVRGPVMSCFSGKCHVLGVVDVGGRGRAFALELLQARESSLARRPFFAKFDPDATWFDDLEPLGPGDAEFFER